MGRNAGRISRSPFGAQRAELVALLGGNEAVAAHLERGVGTFRNTPRGYLRTQAGHFRRETVSRQRQLDAIARTAQQLATRLQGLSRAVAELPVDSAARRSLEYKLVTLSVPPPDGDDENLVTVEPWPPCLEHARLWLERLAEAATWAQSDIAGAENRRGRRVNVDRRFLEELTAEALLLAGERLTKGREGKLAKVLRLTYEAAGVDCPDDFFPILDRLVRQSANGGGLIRTAL